LSSEKNYFTQKKFIEAIAVLSTAKKAGSWATIDDKKKLGVENSIAQNLF